MSDKLVLDIQNLEVCYGPIKALRKVSLYINQGEIIALIGANGAGKSTLLNAIFNVPTVVGGKIYFNGQEITNMPTHSVSHLGVAAVPEGRHIFPNMSVYENLLLGCTPIGYQHQKEDMEKVYELFPVLKTRNKQAAGTLSGGEQQMLAIGRALMGRPKLLLLDEPSLGLAPLIIKNIFKILSQIAASNTTIFLVEQNARMALKISDRGYLLVNGEISLSDQADKLLNNKEIIEGYMGE